MCVHQLLTLCVAVDTSVFDTRSQHMMNMATATQIVVPSPHFYNARNRKSRIPLNSSARVSRTVRADGAVQSNNAATSPSADRVTKVFEDASQGILCYRTKSGEVTCEGFDEGPHFHPSRADGRPRNVRDGASRRILQSSMPWGSSSDAPDMKCTRVEGGGTLCEGRDES